MPRVPIDLVVCGTIGLDDITTPFGSVSGALGGSASYSAIAASYFTQPGILSIVGTDLPAEYRALLASRDIDLAGLETTGKNFRWAGRYDFDLAEATTVATDLNSLEHFAPTVPQQYVAAPVLLLANIDPAIQISVAEQLPNAFTILDTMNFWIDRQRPQLLQAIKLADVLVLNDAEARQLCGEINLVKAAKQLLALGPRFVIIKQGEHGALLFSQHHLFNAPGYPLEVLTDPTGAGDSFAGALSGYLAQRSVYDESLGNVNPEHSREARDEATLRKAVIYGSTVASFCVQDFSVKQIAQLTQSAIRERYHAFKRLSAF